MRAVVRAGPSCLNYSASDVVQPTIPPHDDLRLGARGMAWRVVLGNAHAVSRRAGHAVIAPELPSDDGSADFDAYADSVCTALRGCDGDVVVVAHSLAGATGALVPVRRPVRHLVYLCAAVPEARNGTG